MDFDRKKAFEDFHSFTEASLDALGSMIIYANHINDEENEEKEEKLADLKNDIRRTKILLRLIEKDFGIDSSS